VTEQVRKPGGDRIEHDGGVKNLVGVGEALRDRRVIAAKAEVGEPGTSCRAQGCRARLEFGGADLTTPERLNGFFQFATAANPGYPRMVPRGNVAV
jgi:hypothetical protein